MDLCFWLGVLATLIIGGTVLVANEKSRAIAVAKENYFASLARLKADPTNPDLRACALALGRHYSAPTREQNTVTVYDEVAIANDIGAACASANVANASSPPQRSPDPPDVRLKQLHELFSPGYITNTEYQARRQKILDEI